MNILCSGSPRGIQVRHPGVRLDLSESVAIRQGLREAGAGAGLGTGTNKGSSTETQEGFLDLEKCQSQQGLILEAEGWDRRTENKVKTTEVRQIVVPESFLEK